MSLRLETERLILRGFKEKDIQPFSSYRSDENVARFQGWRAPFSLEKAAQFVHDMRTRTPGQAGQWYQVALELKTDGQMIGDYAFRIDDENQQVEIGVTLAPAYQGQGYAQEAGHCLLDYLFNQLNLHRVFANVDPRNTASKCLMEKLGLRFEGHFIQSMWLKNEWVDEDWYALLQHEWQEQNYL